MAQSALSSRAEAAGSPRGVGATIVGVPSQDRRYILTTSQAQGFLVKGFGFVKS